MKTMNLILIGLGPHAKRIYYPLLEKYCHNYNLNLVLFVELKEQEEKCRNYLSSRSLQPDNLLFIDDEYRNVEYIDDSLRALFNQILDGKDIYGVIIATEPKSHKMYALWALENNYNVLMDKPITSPVGVSTEILAARKIFEDYQEIQIALEKSTANFIVQCQRRNHPGYVFIKNYLDEFINEFKIPISYIDLYHGDGSWYMPDEFWSREGHPFKYGYGKLMHSGYHFINMLDWYAKSNDQIPHKKANTIDLIVKVSRPYDFLHQIDREDYLKLFPGDNFDEYFQAGSMESLKAFGESDVHVICQMKHNEAVITTATLNLMQNSFSRRAWNYLPEDTYRGNGRIRHERANLRVSHLLDIQVHSYQSYESRNRDVRDEEIEGAGHQDHFEIFLFRNSDLVGGKTLEKLSISPEIESQQNTRYVGLQERAREDYFIDFLEGNTSTSHFNTHKGTNLLMSKIYECIAQDHNCLPSSLSFSIEELQDNL